MRNQSFYLITHSKGVSRGRGRSRRPRFTRPRNILSRSPNVLPVVTVRLTEINSVIQDFDRCFSRLRKTINIIMDLLRNRKILIEYFYLIYASFFSPPAYSLLPSPQLLSLYLSSSPF